LGVVLEEGEVGDGLGETALVLPDLIKGVVAFYVLLYLGA
jgi:hypothetical protein